MAVIAYIQRKLRLSLFKYPFVHLCWFSMFNNSRHNVCAVRGKINRVTAMRQGSHLTLRSSPAPTHSSVSFECATTTLRHCYGENTRSIFAQRRRDCKSNERESWETSSLAEVYRQRRPVFGHTVTRHLCYVYGGHRDQIMVQSEPQLELRSLRLHPCGADGRSEDQADLEWNQSQQIL